jgi:hypothetical protein
MRFDSAEAFGERQRTSESRALDLESRLGGDAARVLEHGGDVAVSPRCE